MPKLPLFLVSLIFIVVYSVFIYSKSAQNEIYRPGSWYEADIAVNQAQHFYRLRKERGEFLGSGPCLADPLMKDWVTDIVHNPRQPVDDLPHNQCQSYTEKRSKHIVELDTEGNVVRVK